MTQLPIAAIVSRQSGDADAVLLDFARHLQREGRQVHGLVQDFESCDTGCRIALIDLASGDRYPITQDLGAGSDACRLDTALLTEASQVMRRIAGTGADLAIFNRFGSQEASGGGFAAEMLALMESGIPVLTVVGEKHLAAWRAFTGELGTELPPESQRLDDWFAAISTAG